jgi:hypothetical protein
MCVAGSQKLMQSLTVLPPPPGVLVACSLGLPGERANVLGLATPPPDGVVVDCGGDGGSVAGVCGAGVAIAEGGGGVAVVAAGGGGP